MTLGEVLTLAGYAVGFVVFLAVAKRDGFDSGAMLRLSAVGLVCGAVGARVGQHVFGGGSVDSLLSSQAGGRTIMAGLLAGWLGVEIAKRVMGLRRSTGAAFALALAAGEAVGRVGCHFNECCYGREWDGPFAVLQHGAARFPVQIASAIYAALMFLVLVAMKRRVEGASLFRLYVVLFAGGRFVLEFLRGASPVYGPLTVVQWVCLEVLVSVAVIALVLRTIQRRQEARENV